MAKIFSELLKEYRSSGVGFVLADPSLSNKFDDEVTQPSIKKVFQQDYQTNLLFSEKLDERQLFKQLPNRFAFSSKRYCW